MHNGVVLRIYDVPVEIKCTRYYSRMNITCDSPLLLYSSDLKAGKHQADKNTRHKTRKPLTGAAERRPCIVGEVLGLTAWFKGNEILGSIGMV